MPQFHPSIGEILKSEENSRDAIHIAIAPVIAKKPILPGQLINFCEGSREFVEGADPAIGIADPYLLSPILPNQRFYLFLFPNTITSLRHQWTHPAFEQSNSEKWMRAWAYEYIFPDMYDERTEEAAYQFALKAGYENYLGPCETAQQYIDEEWWNHWEAITGAKGDREAYFSCSC